jgi:hypothetical protein
MNGCPFAENDVAVDDREVKTRAALDIVLDGEVTEEAASDRWLEMADGALLSRANQSEGCSQSRIGGSPSQSVR